MNTFLQAVGVTALVVIGLVVLAALVVVGLYLWLTKVKLPQLKASLESLVDGANTGRPTLTLEPLDDDDALGDRPELRRAADALRATGMERGGTYAVKEMPGAVVVTLADAARAVFATASDVPGFGTNLDVITLYADGRSVVHRTMPPTGVDRPPAMANVYLPHASPAEVVARHLDERPMGDRRSVEPADVAAVVVEQHEAEQDWRDARGGTTPDEFRAAARHGKLADPDMDDLDTLAEQSRAQAAGRVEARLRERFRRETTLSADAWERVRDRLVFVFDTQHRAELAQTLAAAAEGDGEGGRDWHDRDQEISDRLAAGPLREAFAAENAALPAGRRFERLGTVGEPVPADVYAGPDLGDDGDDA